MFSDWFVSRCDATVLRITPLISQNNEVQSASQYCRAYMLSYNIYRIYGFPGSSMVKDPPANAGAAKDALDLGLGRSSGKGNYNSLQKIPWTEEPGRQQFVGLQRVGHNYTLMHAENLYL